jgi:hypothetical protein
MGASRQRRRGSQVSGPAQELVGRLLTMLPGERITAEAALRHGWLVGPEERPLDAVRGNLRSLRANARLRSAMHAATVKTRSLS